MTPTANQAARAGNTITALFLYRRKVNREELNPVCYTPQCSQQNLKQISPNITCTFWMTNRFSNHVFTCQLTESFPWDLSLDRCSKTMIRVCFRYIAYVKCATYEWDEEYLFDKYATYRHMLATVRKFFCKVMC